MANAQFFRGGSPVIRYMWGEKDYPQFKEPFETAYLQDTPPYNAHVDGAYNLGHFTLGMMIRPNGEENVGLPWQRKLLEDTDPQVDEFIDLIVVPADHYVTMLNFKIAEEDKSFAGATVQLCARTVQLQADGTYKYQELTDVNAAVKAQGLTENIDVSKPCNIMVSLMKVTGKVSNTSCTGYAVPLYATPTINAASGGSATFSKTILLGLKVKTRPTDSKVNWSMIKKGWYMSAKIQGFECPTFY